MIKTRLWGIDNFYKPEKSRNLCPFEYKQFFEVSYSQIKIYVVCRTNEEKSRYFRVTTKCFAKKVNFYPHQLQRRT